MSKFKLVRWSVPLAERKCPEPFRGLVCVWRDFLHRWPGVQRVLGGQTVRVSRVVQSRMAGLEQRARRVAKFGDWVLDRLCHLGFLTLAGFCVGCTCISVVGYPACVSGKSMQPSFNPRPSPTAWTFRTASPPEDPFCHSAWEEHTWWTLKEGEADVVMALWAQDWVWVSTWRARDFNLSQGDVVVYISPKDPCDYIIKRVIALEGDIVSSDRYHRPHVRIPEGHLWLEGDNWENSVDSNKYGPVSKGLVFGVASHIVWPPSRWQSLAMEVLHPRLHPERVISSARLREVGRVSRDGLSFYLRVLINFLRTDL